MDQLAGRSCLNRGRRRKLWPMAAKKSSSPRPRWRIRRFLTLVLVLAGLLAADGAWQLHRGMSIPQGAVHEVIAGSAFNANLAELSARGYFANGRQRWYLAAYVRWRHADSLIKAGEYALAPGMSPLDMLALWQSGKAILHELRLIEGWRFSQAWEVIRASPDLVHTLDDDSAARFLEKLNHGDVAAEGRLFPDTYRFPKGTSDLAFLKTANVALEKILEAEWAGRASGLPYEDPAQALVMASIVEKESARADERPLIAGVFVRRLRLGMRLQTDPTVIYGLGERYDGDIHSRDLTRDTPYNTYTRTGLPPTPICLPSRESIRAALHPDDGNTLFFVARGDGSHQFSATLEEHNAAVKRLLARTGDRK